MNQKHAFPCLGDNGLTLRDYFAAKAMQGFAADPNFDVGSEEMAELAYQWAAAMLAAREKPPC